MRTTLEKLLYAIKIRNTSLFNQLIRQLGRESESEIGALRLGDTGDTLLHFAVRCACDDGDETILTEMCQFAEIQSWLEVKNTEGKTPVGLLDKLGQVPVQKGVLRHDQILQRKIFLFLWDKAADKHAACFDEPISASPPLCFQQSTSDSVVTLSALTPLAGACAMGDYALMELLLKNGARPAYASTDYSVTQTQAVSGLLFTHSETSTRQFDVGITSTYFIAIQKGDLAAVRLLNRYKRYSEVDKLTLQEAVDQWRSKSSSSQAEKENAETILKEVLLSLTEFSGFPLDEYDPLMIVCELGDVALFKAIVVKNPESMQRDFFRNTTAAGDNALHVLCRKGHIELLKYILAEDATWKEQLNPLFQRQNKRGEVPLFVACAYQQNRTVRNKMVGAILKAGGDSAALTAAGQSVLSIPELYEDDPLNLQLLSMLLTETVQRADAGVGEHLPLNVLFQQEHPRADMAAMLLQNGASIAGAIAALKTGGVFVGGGEERYQVNPVMRACQLRDAALLSVLLQSDRGEFSVVPLYLTDANTYGFLAKGTLYHLAKSSPNRYYYASPLKPFQMAVTTGFNDTSTLPMASLQLIANFDYAIINTVTHITSSLPAIHPLQYLARRGNLQLLKAFCDNVSVRVLKKLLAEDAIPPLDYANLVRLNPSMMLTRQESQPQFERTVQPHLCLDNIHHYFVGKSKERTPGAEASYQERLNHFAQLLTNLMAIVHEHDFAEKAYQFLKQIPEFTTGGVKVFGWTVRESSDRYRQWLGDWLQVPVDVLQRRLLEYYRDYIQQDPISTDFPAADIAVITALKQKMSALQVQSISVSAKTRPLDYENQVAYAIKTHNQHQLSYLLSFLTPEDVLWQYRHKDAEANGESILHFAVSCAVRYNDVNLVAGLLEQLHDISPQNLKKLMMSCDNYNSSLFQVVAKSSFPKRDELLILLLAYAERTKTINEDVLYHAVIADRQDMIEMALASDFRRHTAIWDRVAAHAIKKNRHKIRNLLERNGIIIFVAVPVEPTSTETQPAVALTICAALSPAEVAPEDLTMSQKWALLNDENTPAEIAQRVLASGIVVSEGALSELTAAGAAVLYPYMLQDGEAFSLQRKILQQIHKVSAYEFGRIIYELSSHRDLVALKALMLIFKNDDKSVPMVNIFKELELRHIFWVTSSLGEMQPIQCVAFVGGLAQFQWLTTQLSADMLAYLCNPGYQHNLLKIVARNPAISSEDFKVVIDSALCWHNLHQYLLDKSKQPDLGEQRRYEQRLQNFAELLVDLEALLTTVQFDQKAAPRLGEIGELETNILSIRGNVIKKSGDRYRKLREVLIDSDLAVVKVRLTEYLRYLNRLESADRGEPLERDFASILLTRMQSIRATRRQHAPPATTDAASTSSTSHQSLNKILR